MMKEFAEAMGYLLGMLIKLFLICSVIAAVVVIAYKIAVSDLPFWFKFWLLK